MDDIFDQNDFKFGGKKDSTSADISELTSKVAGIQSKLDTLSGVVESQNTFLMDQIVQLKSLIGAHNSRIEDLTANTKEPSESSAQTSVSDIAPVINNALSDQIQEMDLRFSVALKALTDRTSQIEADIEVPAGTILIGRQ